MWGKRGTRMSTFCPCYFGFLWSRERCHQQRFGPACNLLWAALSPCFMSSSMWPRTSIVKMNRYGANRQPCLIDHDSLKSLPDSMLTLTEEEASQKKDETHLIYLGLKLNSDRAGKRKPHSILSKVFSKSRRSMIRSCPLSIVHSSDSWARKLLSRMLLPITKHVWLGLITKGRWTWTLHTRILTNKPWGSRDVEQPWGE